MESHVKPAKSVVAHFVDDDMGGAHPFQTLYDFLHKHYDLVISTLTCDLVNNACFQSVTAA